MRWLFITLLTYLTLVQPGYADFLPREWKSPHYSEHPLVGEVFDGWGNQAEYDFYERLLGGQYLLIGETHGNPDHHSLQAGMVSAASKTTFGEATVVFEMIPDRLQHVLDATEGGNEPDLGTLGKDLEWENRGWPSWELYRPIFREALTRNLEMRAGGLDRKIVKEIAKEGMSALSPDRQSALGLNHSLPLERQASLKSELAESHCGLLPKNMLGNMSKVQQAKDGAMASAMMQATGAAVLIAGNGHIRLDRGVPFFLRHLNAKENGWPHEEYRPRKDRVLEYVKGQITTITAIGLIEVSPGALAFADYPVMNEQGEPLYDYVIFTPKADLTDHCAELRERFSKDDDKTKRD